MKYYAKLIETIIYQAHFKSNLFCICLSFADKTMEHKRRFGVRNSSIQELRLFQLGLRRKKLKMGFETRAKVFVRGEKVEKTVKANIRKVSIHPFHPRINSFKLPRQGLQQTDEITIIIHLNDVLDISVEFYTLQDCERFKNALGNLDPE
jgi:hypothetical protein